MYLPSLCPDCGASLVPFNLLENDAHFCIIFSQAKIEDGLAPNGLRCSGKPSHDFGFCEGRLVEIECRFTSEYIDPPTVPLKDRIAHGIANLFFDWFNWAPFPKRVFSFFRGQLLCPWQVAGAWFKSYDPNEPWMSADEEARLIAEAREDAELDREHDEAIRRQEELDAYEAENEADAWDEHRADEEDRDHGTYFPDEDDDGWEQDWDDEGDSASETVKE